MKVPTKVQKGGNRSNTRKSRAPEKITLPFSETALLRGMTPRTAHADMID